MASKPNYIDTQQYNTTQYSYPDNVGQSPDLQHYVIFHINVRSGSQFKYNINGKQTPRNIGGPTGNNLADKSLNGQTLTNALEVLGTATIVGGLASAAKNISKGGYKSGKAAGEAVTSIAAAGAAAIGLTVGAIETSGGILKTNNKQRLSDTVVLATQERPSVSYGINYQDKDMGVLGGFLLDQDSSKQMAGASALLQLAKLPSIIPGFAGGSPSDLVQLTSKAKTNPFREVLFEGVDYRKFNFKYKFMPKNAKESEAVRQIISLFKEHMHPELAGDGYFYIYPSEFEIEYHYNGKENGYFNKITNCALTDMTVDYGGEQFSSFNNGAPTEVNMTLSFRELELLTKNSIKREGF